MPLSWWARLLILRLLIFFPAFQGKDPAAFSHLEDPRQCALCLKYGDADSKVKAAVWNLRLWSLVLGGPPIMPLFFCP